MGGIEGRSLFDRRSRSDPPVPAGLEWAAGTEMHSVRGKKSSAGVGAVADRAGSAWSMLGKRGAVLRPRSASAATSPRPWKPLILSTNFIFPDLRRKKLLPNTPLGAYCATVEMAHRSRRRSSVPSKPTVDALPENPDIHHVAPRPADPCAQSRARPPNPCRAAGGGERRRDRAGGRAVLQARRRRPAANCTGAGRRRPKITPDCRSQGWKWRAPGSRRRSRGATRARSIVWCGSRTGLIAITASRSLCRRSLSTTKARERDCSRSSTGWPRGCCLASRGASLELAER